MVMRLTWTGQPSRISQVGLAANGVSPGQTGMLAEIVGLISQMLGACMLALVRNARSGQCSKKNMATDRDDCGNFFKIFSSKP
jgi:hypothetical protein